MLTQSDIAGRRTCCHWTQGQEDVFWFDLLLNVYNHSAELCFPPIPHTQSGKKVAAPLGDESKIYLGELVCFFVCFFFLPLEDGRRSNNMLQLCLVFSTCSRKVLLQAGRGWKEMLLWSGGLSGSPTDVADVAMKQNVTFVLVYTGKGWSSTMLIIDTALIKQNFQTFSNMFWAVGWTKKGFEVWMDQLNGMREEEEGEEEKDCKELCNLVQFIWK